jgi:hypothetical protein
MQIDARDRLALVRNVVERGLEKFSPHKANVLEAKAKAAHMRTFEKYKWYADYFNEVAGEVGDEPIDLSQAKYL